MSKVIDRKDPEEIFVSNRDKLIKTLLQEITFLNYCFSKCQTEQEKSIIRKAISKFENLLKIRGQSNDNLEDREFLDLLCFIHSTIQEVIKGVNSL